MSLQLQLKVDRSEQAACVPPRCNERLCLCALWSMCVCDVQAPSPPLSLQLCAVKFPPSCRERRQLLSKLVRMLLISASHHFELSQRNRCRVCAHGHPTLSASTTGVRNCGLVPSCSVLQPLGTRTDPELLAPHPTRCIPTSLRQLPRRMQQLSMR